MKKYVLVGISVFLNIIAFLLARANQEFMRPGYIPMLISGFVIEALLILYFIYRDIRGRSPKSNENAVIALLAFGVVINLFVLSADNYDHSKNSTSIFNYFFQSGGRNMARVEIDYDAYQKNFISIFYDLLDEKEVFVDSRIVGSNFLQLLKYMNINVVSLDIQDFQKKTDPQVITFVRDNMEKELLLFTGDTFEATNKIFIFEHDNQICFSPEEDLVISRIEPAAIKISDELEYQKVVLSFHPDATIERMQAQPYVKWKMFWLLIFIFFNGLLLLVPLILKNKLNLAVLLALPTGSVLQIMSIMTIGLFRISVRLPNVLLSNFAIIAFSLFLYYFCKGNRGGVQVKMQLSNLFVLAFLVGSFAYFSADPHVFLSYDSYCNVLIGKQIAASGDLQSQLGMLLLYSKISPIWQSLASMFHIPLNYALQPAFVLSGVAAIFYLQCEILAEKGVDKKTIFAITALAFLGVYTVPQVIINFTWILNNLAVGICGGLSVVLLYKYLKSKDNLYLCLAYLFFIITGIARSEGGVFAVLYLVLIYSSELSKFVKKLFIWSFTFLYAILQVYFFFMADVISDRFWTPHKGFMPLVLLGLFSLFVLCEDWVSEKIYWISVHIESIMLACVLLGGIVLSVVNSYKVANNAGNFIMNLISTGYYAILILQIFNISALFSAQKSEVSKDTWSLWIQSATYPLLIFLLMLTSVFPTRVGYGDSSCRMILHILPVWGLLLSNMAVELVTAGKNKRSLPKKKRK